MKTKNYEWPAWIHEGNWLLERSDVTIDLSYEELIVIWSRNQIPSEEEIELIKTGRWRAMY